MIAARAREEDGQDMRDVNAEMSTAAKKRKIIHRETTYTGWKHKTHSLLHLTIIHFGLDSSPLTAVKYFSSLCWNISGRAWEREKSVCTINNNMKKREHQLKAYGEKPKKNERNLRMKNLFHSTSYTCWMRNELELLFSMTFPRSEHTKCVFFCFPQVFFVLFFSQFPFFIGAGLFFFVHMWILWIVIFSAAVSLSLLTHDHGSKLSDVLSVDKNVR